MYSFRHLYRLSSFIRNHKLIISYNKCNNPAFLINANVPPGTFVREYAKGKDKKKEKNVHAKKIEINENLISTYIDLENLHKQYKKPVEIMREEFIKNLSLRSTTGSIETIKISFDGKEHELQELAQIVRKNPKAIVINMISFPQVIPAVIQALQKSGMNLNPQQDGTTIFVPVPKVTKEHRDNLSKNAKTLFLKCRGSIKDIQNAFIKKIKNNSEISSDDSFSLQNQITSLADKYVIEGQQMLDIKVRELIGSEKA